MLPTRLRTTAAALMLAALGLVGVSAGPAAAADDDTPWSVKTASNSFGADRQNYGYTLNPGGALEDGITVANRGTTPLDLAVYGADAFTTDAGRLDLVGQDAPSTGVGAWVHAARSHVTIQPGKSVDVPFTVTLPKDAKPGDYMGGIVTSLTRPDANGVDVDRRLAIRIRLRVGGALNPSLAVEDLHVDYSNTFNPFAKGDASLTYTIHNTGNAIVAARQAATVSGPFGSLRAQAAKMADTPELLPGEKWKVSVPVHGVAPALRLAGTVTLTPLVTDASGSITSLAPVGTTSHALAIPWALLLLILVPCGLVIVLIRVLRRALRKLEKSELAPIDDPIERMLREPETSDR